MGYVRLYVLWEASFTYLCLNSLQVNNLWHKKTRLFYSYWLSLHSVAMPRFSFQLHHIASLEHITTSRVCPIVSIIKSWRHIKMSLLWSSYFPVNYQLVSQATSYRFLTRSCGVKGGPKVEVLCRLRASLGLDNFTTARWCSSKFPQVQLKIR